MKDILYGKKFSLAILGCRVNHYEAEALASMLVDRGAVYLPDETGCPDIVLLLACSITSVSNAKTRKLIRRYRRRNREAVLVVTGCYEETLDPVSLDVDLLVPNRMKREIPEALVAHLRGGRVRTTLARGPEWEAAWDGLYMKRPLIHSRAFVKVQEGCARLCSYCIVPSLRGGPVSREPGDVLREIADILSAGCREVVLTGVHLGCYNVGGYTLADLIRGVGRLDGLVRLRIGSIEPFALGDDLLAAMAETSAFCPHLHVPLQSGDDAVLARMRRGYTAEGFSSIAGRVRAHLGADVHLSTDLMIGFPGETEEAFVRSLNLLRELRVGKVHVFPFSPRPGTDAAAMAGVVSPQVMKERARIAGRQADLLLEEYAESRRGQSDLVLAEERDDGIVSGWTRHYLRVLFRGENEKMRNGNLYFVNPKFRLGAILLGEGIDAERLDAKYIKE